VLGDIGGLDQGARVLVPYCTMSLGYGPCTLKIRQAEAGKKSNGIGTVPVVSLQYFSFFLSLMCCCCCWEKVCCRDMVGLDNGLLQEPQGVVCLEELAACGDTGTVRVLVQYQCCTLP